MTGLAGLLAAPAGAFEVAGDGIAASLTGGPGDAARGRAVLVSRHSTCLLCHRAPFPEERFQGSIGPDLAGVGDRLTAAQIRLRIVDPARLNPDTVMPAYFKTEGLNRVGRAWQGKPALEARQIEDLVALLAGLKAP
ncbi:MAG: sulfur oxidation c-type cytochrome SoxX [Alphaproteobacteria bacterium]|nr:sulfur oxidation c-type cytochrome SoxX [Alphaproteobacteria bacterium]